MRFTGVCLITEDVLALSGFYQQVLGVRGEGDKNHMALSLDGGELAIYSKEGMERMAPGSMRLAGCGNFTLGFQVLDVDAEYERIKDLGVEFILLPTTHPWGSRSFWFRDLDGNIVDFYALCSVRDDRQ